MSLSATGFLFIAVIVWLGIGAVTALVMARRGHEVFGWAVLGAVFGPIGVLLAIDAARSEGEPPLRVFEGSRGGGSTDVVVGMDGSVDAIAALEGVLELLGERVGRLTLATVVDHGAWSRSSDPLMHEQLVDPLRRVAAMIDRPAEGVVLTGEPAAELARFAREGEFDLLVVGARGRGFAKVFGSVARRLAHGAGVPVMMIGSGPHRGSGDGSADEQPRAIGAAG